jgi:hypothetical protein
MKAHSDHRRLITGFSSQSNHASTSGFDPFAPPTAPPRLLPIHPAPAGALIIPMNSVTTWGRFFPADGGVGSETTPELGKMYPQLVSVSRSWYRVQQSSVFSVTESSGSHHFVAVGMLAWAVGKLSLYTTRGVCEEKVHSPPIEPTTTAAKVPYRLILTVSGSRSAFECCESEDREARTARGSQRAGDDSG